MAKKTGGNIIKVAFFQLVCPGYKRSMFEGLQQLSEVELTLFVGDKNPPGAPPSESLESVSRVLIKNIIVIILGLVFVWQSTSNKFRIRDYDLVILPEGVLYLSNYFIMAKCWFYRIPFGLYTHGFNYQRKNTHVAKLLERFRAFVHRRCDFLIVYSEEGKKHLSEINKVSIGKIFVAQNTLDVNSILKRSGEITKEDLLQCRDAMGVSATDVLLMYVGRVSSEKNPEWVVQAVSNLRNQGLSVHAAFVGDGPALMGLKEYVSTLSLDAQKSIHILGRIPMENVDLYLKTADISVMPGMTGLAIVHSFALGKPYITVNSPYHSPEICYLKDGVNGMMADNDKDSFCDAVSVLVNNPQKRKLMGECAYQSAVEDLSMDNQIKAFDEVFRHFNKCS